MLLSVLKKKTDICRTSITTKHFMTSHYVMLVSLPSRKYTWPSCWYYWS